MRQTSIKKPVFPARAGMSPDNAFFGSFFWGVPRASGDEPSHLKTSHTVLPCSPRERG